jgi:hypothetical protein
VPSTENYVEVTLKPSDAPANQTGSRNIIIVQVPRSKIDSHRLEHQAQEAVTDELIAQALAEGSLPDISRAVTDVGGANLIERSRFLPERPLIIEGRSPDYDRNGFKGWIIKESIIPSAPSPRLV